LESTSLAPASRNFSCITKNVAEDEEAFADLERMGTMATPGTEIGGEKIVVGFDWKELERILSGKRGENGV
jgi:hypothetical protein